MTFQVDFSGWERFLKIANSLLAGHSIRDVTWQELFDTPGYRALVEKEFSRDFFKDCFTMVFSPKREDDLTQGLRGPRSSYLQYYSKIRESLPELIQQTELLREKLPEITSEASKEAKHLLPSVKHIDPPSVAIVVFGRDARGYTPLVVDAGFAVEMGELLGLLLAHESHHYYRDRLLGFDRNAVKSSDRDLIWVLDQIHMEGVADLIDKPRWFLNGNDVRIYPELAAAYRKELLRAPEIIEGISSVIDESAGVGSSSATIGKKVRDLIPMSGHTVGYYMASRIQERIGTKAIRNSIYNPFAFFFLYSQCVIACEPDISPRFLRLMAQLEAEYMNKK